MKLQLFLGVPVAYFLFTGTAFKGTVHPYLRVLYLHINTSIWEVNIVINKYFPVNVKYEIFEVEHTIFYRLCELSTRTSEFHPWYFPAETRVIFFDIQDNIFNCVPLHPIIFYRYQYALLDIYAKYVKLISHLAPLGVLIVVESSHCCPNRHPLRAESRN